MGAAVNATTAQLRERLHAVRADPTASSARRVNAFEDYSNQATAEGHPLDALRRFTADEVERFWSFTVAGAEHVYWNGPEAFRLNDGHYRQPRRWVWMRQHGTKLASHMRVVVTCGEPNCVALGHLGLLKRENLPKYSDDQALGAIQVVAMRLGHPPTALHWKTHKQLRPSHALILQRFGSWERALRAAGLNPDDCLGLRFGFTYTEGQLINALHTLAQELGRAPTPKDWRCVSIERGWPDYKTVTRRLGGGTRHWEPALKRAGLA